MEWISTEKEMPKAEKPVLACGLNSHGKIRRLRACYISKHFKESDGDNYLGDCDYCEHRDIYYWPKGWYEWNEYEDKLKK